MDSFELQQPFFCIAVLQAVGMMMIPIEAMPGYVVPVQDMCYPAGRARNLESHSHIHIPLDVF